MSDIIDTQRVSFTFIWKMENFSLVPKLPKNEIIWSPIFTADNLDNTQWFVRLKLDGRSQDNTEAFLFQLYKSSANGINCISLDYELSILSKADSQVKSVTKSAFYFHSGNPLGTSVCITPHEIFSKGEILPGDTLTVQCKMWHHKRQCLEPGFSLAITRIGVERKSFTWTIDKFSTMQVNDQKSVSVELFTNLQLCLTITLFLTGGTASGEQVRMKIQGKNEERNSFSMLDVSVQDANGESVHHFQSEFTLRKENIEWQFPMILERKQLIETKDLLLPGDVLSLKCNLVVFDKGLNRIEHTVYGEGSSFDLKAALTNMNQSLRLGKKVHSSSNSLTKDLRHLLEEQQFADVNLRVHDETFPAHKAILAARSSVFKTMFDTDMREKLTNTIEISDFEPDTIRRLLLYVYSDTLDSNIPWENASTLYLAAEKYAIISLKEKCSSCLMANLNVTNVCETLVLADTLNDEDLKDFVLSFIQDKDKDVINSNEWKDFTQEHPQLTVEILTYLYRNVKQF